MAKIQYTAPMPYVAEFGKGHITGILIALVVAYWLLNSIRLLFFHPLSKYPGPKLWAISRLPWTLHIIKGDLWQVLAQFHTQYGTYVRIAPDEITTTDPAAWRDVYTTRPVLAKDPSSLTPPLNGAHSLFTAEAETHRRIRAALVHGFSEQAQRAQAPIVEMYGGLLVARLQRELEAAGEREGVVDVARVFGYATFDTVTDLSYGEAMLDALEGDAHHDEIYKFFLHAKFGTIRNCLSRYWPLDALLGLWLLRVTRPSRERNWRLTTEKISRRLARGDLTGVRSDLLTPLVGKLSEDGHKGSITKQELITNQLAFVIADCQLTTVALAASTFLLLRDASAAKWRVLADEVRSTFASDKLITVQSTQGLPYLEAVIQETMRLHHPTPISLPRVIEPEGRKVNGRWIPGNTIFGVNLHCIQNDEKLWYQPREFHPERFLPVSHERYNRVFDDDVKAAFQPFSTGPRNCIGYRVFLAQARVFLARVAWNFDMSLVEGQQDWLQQEAYLVFEPKALRVRLSRRTV